MYYIILYYIVIISVGRAVNGLQKLYLKSIQNMEKWFESNKILTAFLEV